MHRLQWRPGTARRAPRRAPHGTTRNRSASKHEHGRIGGAALVRKTRSCATRGRSRLPRAQLFHACSRKRPTGIEAALPRPRQALPLFARNCGGRSNCDQPGTVGRAGRRSVALHAGAARHRLSARRSRRAVRGGARGNGAVGGAFGAGAARRMHGDRGPAVRQRIRDRAGRDAYSRAELADELCRQRHQRTRPRRRGAGLRARCHDRHAVRGAVGAPLRFGDHPPAQAIPARATRRRGLLRVRDIPDLERIPGHAGEPCHRQRRDRETAPDGDPADGAGRAHLPRGPRSRPGCRPNLVTLCLDTVEAPIGKTLVTHPQTAIVDFTGSARFGAWVEENAHPALCFSETSGVNTVVVESVDSLEPVLKSLATTMSLFSAQMCTSPQNMYVPRDGIRCGDTKVGRRRVRRSARGGDRSRSPATRGAPAPIMAAIQSPATPALIEQVAVDARAAREGAARIHAVRAPRVPESPARDSRCWWRWTRLHTSCTARSDSVRSVS